ncbi:MAG: winged helix-turn-helix transcriptional regulator, partial [Treponema sp.]|nr:winged helix-turn-helix transcriptional regulator [Treponema sp.]
SPGSIYGSLTLEEALKGRSSIRNKTLARTLEKIDVLEGWGSGFKRIFAECDEYGVDRPEFLEIGDMLRVNFYRPSYKNNGDKSDDKAQKTAINQSVGDKNGDKSAINQNVGDKSAINYKGKILEYLSNHSEARSQDIALFIGLKQSRTKDYLSELVENGKIVANGANRNRTYSLK